MTLSGTTGGIGVIGSATAQNSTSGTSIDFTGIPAGVKRVTVMFNGVSTNGSSALVVQIGSGSVTTTGYSCTAVGFSTNALAAATSSTGFQLEDSGTAAYAFFGNFVLTNQTGNNWTAGGMFVRSQASGFTCQSSGFVSLGGAIDRVRITTVNGTDTFDAGSINILYE
jgi:hypothetical protein